MTVEITYESRQLANEMRQQYSEFVADGDDRRRRTVTYHDDAPDSVQPPTDDDQESDVDVDAQWDRYDAALVEMSESLAMLEQEWEEAQSAARTIDEELSEHQHFTGLELLQAELLDLVRKASATCRECHADHSEHSHEVDSGSRETLREFLRDDAAETDVGVGEENA